MKLSAAAGLLIFAACGGGGASLHVVEPVDVPAASGAPHVGPVIDLGAPFPLPLDGHLSNAASDGKFTVGEYVLIGGSSFGKQPTVLIGGRAARVVARTSGGGILSQIPAGVAAGPVAIEVSNLRGRSAMNVPVTRYAVVTQPDAGKVHVLALDGGKASAAASADVPGAMFVRVSADGAWAYVVGDGVVATVSLAAKGGPAVTHTTKLAVDGVVDAAIAGPSLLVVGQKQVQTFALAEPATPAPYTAVKLDDALAAGRIIAADASPDGKTLALLLADGNRVVLMSLDKPEAPVERQTLELLPGQRLALARDLAYDASGALWIVAGDNAGTFKTGHVPTRLVRVDPDGGTPRAPVDVAGAGPPMAIRPSPVAELASGAAIRDTSDDLPIFVTSVDERLLATDGDGGAAVAAAAKGLAQPGSLVRTSGAGTGGPLTLADGLMPGAVAVAPAGDVIVATAWKLAGDAPVFGVIVRAAGGEATGTFVELGAARPAKVRLPAALGDAQIQP